MTLPLTLISRFRVRSAVARSTLNGKYVGGFVVSVA